MDMMLDSGSSVSLVRKDVLSEVSGVCAAGSRELRLVTAAGEPIPVLGYVSAPVKVGQVSVEHPFVVVKSLIAGVILGIDFLRQHELVLDFAFSPIKVLSRNQPIMADDNHTSPWCSPLWIYRVGIGNYLYTLQTDPRQPLVLDQVWVCFSLLVCLWPFQCSRVISKAYGYSLPWPAIRVNIFG